MNKFYIHSMLISIEFRVPSLAKFQLHYPTKLVPTGAECFHFLKNENKIPESGKIKGGKP